MRLYVISNDCVLSAAHVLAYIGHVLLDAARNVVTAISHAPNDGRKIYLAVLRILQRSTYRVYLTITAVLGSSVLGTLPVLCCPRGCFVCCKIRGIVGRRFGTCSSRCSCGCGRRSPWARRTSQPRWCSPEAPSTGRGLQQS